MVAAPEIVAAPEAAHLLCVCEFVQTQSNCRITTRTGIWRTSCVTIFTINDPNGVR